jgi:type II secretory ATPase GspE/PulE/Tfp pilus assembly ATPase PilB-like protein
MNMTVSYIESTSIDFPALVGVTDAIDYDVARAFRVVPVLIKEQIHMVLITDADMTLENYRKLRFILKRECVFCKVDNSLFAALAEQTWPNASETFYTTGKQDGFKAKVIMDNQAGKATGSQPEFSVQQSGQQMVSVIEIVDDLFSKAISGGASDIHIEPDSNDLKVRFRLDGVLQQVMTIPKNRQNEIISRIKILARMDIAEKRRPQDGRILVEGKKKSVDVRVSSMPTSAGEKIVLRLLDKSAQPLDLISLGLQGRNYDLFCTSIRKPSGMILVTGPTGSGKTTTLYAALKEIHSSKINISTVEDPVEYQISGINQTQYNPDIDYTFATAVKTFLRQDPDVIMIGEIRDPDTAKYAIQASQTGHLVFSTLHTNDAPGAVVRMLEMGMEPYLVASTLQLVIAQRLLRTTCKSCGKLMPLTDREKMYASQNNLKIDKVFRGEGCRECMDTGHKGRVGVYEIMYVTPELQELIALKTPTQKIRDKAIEQGMKTLMQEALLLVENGKTTLEEVEACIG